MKIYTRKGDDGTTGLLGGTRVLKSDLRIEAYGTVDELNAALGMLLMQPDIALLKERLETIQHQLFTIGSHFANDSETSHFVLPAFPESTVTDLETSMDDMEATLPELKNFILPGGHPANAVAHLARCICRRAERYAVALSRQTQVDPVLIHYLNRLSDWLFVASRFITHQTGSPEVIWKAS